MSMSLRSFSSIEDRRKFIETERNLNLRAVSVYPEGLAAAAQTNCENMIGAVQVPLGVAGPLLVKGTYATGNYFIPLATTEGALVASVNRGCKALTQAGGVDAAVKEAGITRGPIFETSSLAQSMELSRWIPEHMQALQEKAQQTSGHLTLIDVQIKPLGRTVYVRFSFDTQDAMGMNMATIATDALSDFICEQTSVRRLTIAGNFDVDKKPAWLNSINGRGRMVWAEAVIPSEIVRDTLKTSVEDIHRLCQKKCHLGSAVSGSIGLNAQCANVVAAVFLATGQDPAHVVEGSLGITTTDIDSDQLVVSLHLPDVPIGTIGGGTILPSQQECLQMMGVAGGNNGKNAKAFSEILGAAVLAGELSLLASLAEGSLAKAHKKLARKLT